MEKSKTKKQVISEIIKQLVDEIKPLKVILFGSASGKDPDRANDIDLLIVVTDGTHRRKTAQKLYRSIDSSGIPVDFVVVTPSDLKQHGDKVGLIYKDILDKGVELYVA